MRYCTVKIMDKALKHIRPCNNRVIPFVDGQKVDECFACYERKNKLRDEYDTGHGYNDRNDGGTPK